MSAAIQFPSFSRFAQQHRARAAASSRQTVRPADHHQPFGCDHPDPTIAFYRKRTEQVLRRYLLCSMLIGRRPTALDDVVFRGWASHSSPRTFEDHLIFVLDMERCLDRLLPLHRQLITRIAFQEYTEAETALLLNRSERSIRTRFREAIDQLTVMLLNSGLMQIPKEHALNRGN